MKVLLLSLLASIGVHATAPHQEALLLALDDEYKAKATYQQVIEDFGAVRPFGNIVRSEESHIQALLPLLVKYGVSIPENPYMGKVGFYESLKDACEAGVQAEIENVALYDRIDSLVDQYDIQRVFDRLRWASQERHLPAFERCAARN